METRFDVVTYSQTDSGSLFLRREEFIAVSCECTLRTPPAEAEDAGRRPTLWAGDEYDTGQVIAVEGCATLVAAICGGVTPDSKNTGTFKRCPRTCSCSTAAGR